MARSALFLAAFSLCLAILVPLPYQASAFPSNDEAVVTNEVAAGELLLKQLITYMAYAEADKQINRSCPPALRGNSNVPCYAFLESCYCFPRIPVVLADANAFCVHHGMNLTSIETEAEATMLRLYLQTQGWQGGWHWTSGKRVDGKWKWMATDKEISYTNWQGGQPNNVPHELYLTTEPVNQKWHDAAENHAAYPICEKALR